MKIREMQPGDLSALEKIYLEARIKTFHWWNPNDFKPEEFEQSTQGEIVFVAENNGIIVGFISMGQDNFIHNLFIGIDEQGQGIGKALMEYAFVNYLKKPVRLKCTVRNTPACGFYEANGWKIEQANVQNDPDAYHLYVFT